jgi:hypothetical protein
MRRVQVRIDRAEDGNFGDCARWRWRFRNAHSLRAGISRLFRAARYGDRDPAGGRK